MGGGCLDEIVEHLLSCENEELKQVRKNGYLAIQRDCDVEKVPSNFTRVFHQAFTITLEQASPIENEMVRSRCTALRIQKQIGFYNMVVEFLSNDWTSALEQLGVKHPQTVITQLLAMI